MGASRARIGARRAPPEGRSRVVRGSSEAVQGYCTLEEAERRGPIVGFPRNSGLLPRMLIFSGRALMCRAGPSAHGSPCTKNRHFRNNLGIMRKTRDWPAGAPLSDVQYPAIMRCTPTGPRPGRRRHWRPRSASGTSCACGRTRGERGPVNREEWRSGRIVPPRTRRPLRRSRGIMRMSPGASGARRRTILPERQNRAGGGAGSAAIDSAGRLGATLPP